MLLEESENTELKAIYTDDIKKEVIAFANTNGGKIYIGVSDDGEACGVDDADKTSLRVSNMVRDAIKPDLTMFVHYSVESVDDKKIVVVDINEGTERPYYIAKKGLKPEGVYVRQGNSSVPASNQAIRKMIKESDGDSFEDMRSLDQELTFDAAEKEFEKRNVKFQINQRRSLGIIFRDDVFSNLGLLLSDECKHTIKAAVFNGTDPLLFQDRKEFSGSLFTQLNSAYEFIDIHNENHSTFDKLYRIDKRDYPEVAIREALLNMLVHRDYSLSASSIISLYSDRIEFTSIGGLVGGITIDDINNGVSICRNPKLANVFYRLNLIEAYGTGIIKIKKAYENEICTPEIITSDNVFKVILPNINYDGNINVSKPYKLHHENDEEAILELAEKNKYITRKDVEQLTNKGQTASGLILRRMIDSGELVRLGNGKASVYALKG